MIADIRFRIEVRNLRQSLKSRLLSLSRLPSFMLRPLCDFDEAVKVQAIADRPGTSFYRAAEHALPLLIVTLSLQNPPLLPRTLLDILLRPKHRLLLHRSVMFLLWAQTNGLST